MPEQRWPSIACTGKSGRLASRVFPLRQVRPFSCSFTRCSLILTRPFTYTGAKKEPATSLDHETPRRPSSGTATAVTKDANGKAVNKEAAVTSGKAIVKTVKQSVNVKVASDETKIKGIGRKPGTKESWWQNLE